MTDPALASPIRKLVDLYQAERRDGDEAMFEIAPRAYFDEALARAERETVFARAPVILGHESELAEPGDIVALERLGLPILMTRDRAGAINAFLNVCRHRGTRIVAQEGACRKAALVCPYHHWSYGLDGGLRHVPCAEEGFPSLDRAAYGLTRLPVAVRHGLIFVVPDPAGRIEADAGIGALDADFDAFGLGGHRLFRRTVQRRQTNWKLVIDAFLEGYHIKRLHQKTIGPFFMDGHATLEPIGRHIRAAVARNEFSTAVGRPEAEWDERAHVTFSYYVYPNCILVLHPDYVSQVSLFPLSGDETLYVHSMLTPRPAASEKEHDHWARSFELIDGGVFQAEDIHISEEIQRGLRSGANRRLTYGRFENGIRLFHETLDRETGHRTVSPYTS